METFDIRLCGLRTGTSYERRRQGGAEGEMQRVTTALWPTELEHSKIVFHVLVCDSQSNNG